jgi:hypothetical protein
LTGAKLSLVPAGVKPLARDEARDEVLVEQLVRLINRAYAVGEAGLCDGSSDVGGRACPKASTDSTT